MSISTDLTWKTGEDWKLLKAALRHQIVAVSDVSGSVVVHPISLAQLRGTPMILGHKLPVDIFILELLGCSEWHDAFILCEEFSSTIRANRDRIAIKLTVVL